MGRDKLQAAAWSPHGKSTLLHPLPVIAAHLVFSVYFP